MGLRLALAPRTGPVRADGTQIEQVVMNHLVTNAWQPPGDRPGEVTTGVECDAAGRVC